MRYGPFRTTIRAVSNRLVKPRHRNFTKMSPPVVTEIGLLSLKADTSIDVPDSAAGKTWKSVVDALLAQEGAKRLHWGRQVENPNLVEWLLDWDTAESHQKFRASSAFGPFKEDLRLILDRVPTFIHANFAPDSPASVLSRTPSGIIEHLTFYFEPNLSEADRSRWEAIYKPFANTITEHAKGFKASVAGWVVEEVPYEGTPATVFLATLGWDSVDLHLAYRKTKEFQESIVPVRDGCKGRVFHHVTFQEEKK